ncbi:MAG: type II toxin-antitoxin system VapC family toxin [Nitrososphaerales archaeon]
MDANLLIYLNTRGDKQDPDLEKFYTSLLREELYTDLLILDETLYLSKSKYRVPYELTFEFLKTNVLPYSTVIPIDELDFSLMERYLSKYKIKPSDAIHLSAMEKEGVTNIASEDGEFDDVKEVKRIWFSKSETSPKKIETKRNTQVHD